MDISAFASEYSKLESNDTPQQVTVALGITYAVLTCVMSVLSICGSLIILYILVTMSELRTKGRMFLAYLSCSDLLVAVSNFLGVVWVLIATESFIQVPDVYSNNSDNSTLISTSMNTTCKIQAAATSTASLMSFFWTSVIALNIYLTVVRQNRYLTTKLWLMPHLICWGVPIVILIITATFNKYGYNEIDIQQDIWWCWISASKTTQPSVLVRWQLLSGKLWEIGSYIFICILYGKVMYNIVKYVSRMKKHQGGGAGPPASDHTPLHNRTSRSTAVNYANKKLLFVPLVFILARIWGTLRFFLYSSNESEPTLASKIAVYLAPLQGLGDSAQGFFNCVVFIFTTPHVRDKLPCRRFKIKFKRSQDNHRSNLSHEDIITSSSKHSSNDDTPPTPNYGSMKQHGNSSSSHTVGISGDGVTYSCSPKDSKS